ncbi:iron (metal) dependent repressor, DtxR family [Flavobacteriaceae bacterium MAR_2010_188]|nr:iron (metal) dependent repressor, DtxR family [Flavobacteriaceae bacterium MAR_2010_188]
MSVAVENFIKAIYKNDHQDHNDTKPGNIAKKLGISNAAATDMAKKLAAKDLLNYEKYQALQLTPKGTEMALNVIRKHRLWESFLFKFFDMSLHEIHREAELLEHETSDFLADKISEFLGNPSFDPHGDPIPNSEGKITTDDHSIPLDAAEEGKIYKVARLVSDDKDFFDFCSQHGLKYGNSFKVLRQFNNTNMTEVRVNSQTLLLNKEFTNLIYVLIDE